MRKMGEARGQDSQRARKPEGKKALLSLSGKHPSPPLFKRGEGLLLGDEGAIA